MATFCAACGNSIAAGERFCRVCGRDSTAPLPPPMAPVGASQIPGTAFPGAAVPGAPFSSTPVSAAPVETSGKAIVSLVCGLFFLFFPASIAAIIFGHLSLSEIRKSAGRLQGHGLAIAGLVLGYAGAAFIPVVLIIAAIAIPNLLRARMAANESTAVGSVRMLVAAEITYSTNHTETGFTCSLPDLSRDQLISEQLARGTKNGYKFELENCNPPTEGGANVKFQIVAYPVTLNTTGRRAFCADESNVIKVDESGSVQSCMETGKPL